MADKKISQLTAANTPLAGTEVLPIVQSGSTVKVASDDLTVKNVRSNATTGILQVAGPGVGTTRTMTVPNANFTAARTDAAQTFTGDQTFGTVLGTTFDTNVAAAGVTLTGVTLSADGTDANININITPKGTGEVALPKVNIDGGAIDGTPIGANSASTGAFSTLSASGNVTLSGGTANGVLYLSDPGKVATSGATLQFNGSNLAVGRAPSAWWSGFKAIQLGTDASAFVLGRTDSQPHILIGANAFFDGADWKYLFSESSARYDINGANHRWYCAASGTAGNNITYNLALTLDENRNLLLNGNVAPASGVGTFAIFNGTAPTGSVTDGCVLYTEDVSTSSELKVRDEAGNVTTLSPHNFSLIPEGPSEDMAWSYYSERDGKRINIDMLKAIRVLEKLSGEKLVHES